MITSYTFSPLEYAFALVTTHAQDGLESLSDTITALSMSNISMSNRREAIVRDNYPDSEIPYFPIVSLIQAVFISIRVKTLSPPHPWLPTAGRETKPRSFF